MLASSRPWLALTSFLVSQLNWSWASGFWLILAKCQVKARPQGLTQLQDQQIRHNQQIQQIQQIQPIQPIQRILLSLREGASQTLWQDSVSLLILRLSSSFAKSSPLLNPQIATKTFQNFFPDFILCRMKLRTITAMWRSTLATTEGVMTTECPMKHWRKNTQGMLSNCPIKLWRKTS